MRTAIMVMISPISIAANGTNEKKFNEQDYNIKQINKRRNMKYINKILLLILAISTLISNIALAGTKDTNDNDILDTSINKITVISPNGGENWRIGSTHTIKWIKIGEAADFPVFIALHKNGEYSPILREYPSSSDVINQCSLVTATCLSSYNWTVSLDSWYGSWPIGNYYKIDISCIGCAEDISDKSDNNFAINSAPLSSITVVSPNGGESWKRGTTKTIKWVKTGNTGTKVKIELLKGRKSVRTISSNAPNTGSYNWKIIANAGNDYKIRITSMSNPTYKDISDNNFKIS